MTIPNSGQHRDLPPGMSATAIDPATVQRLEPMKPRVAVDAPPIVTQGVGDRVPGQTTRQ